MGSLDKNMRWRDKIEKDEMDEKDEVDRMLKVILWDVDGTLLDFEVAEEAAIHNLFRQFNIGTCTNEMLERYKEINRFYWERLEKGVVSREKVLIGRFQDFFQEMGIDRSLAEDFNKAYQSALGDTIAFRDNSYELVKQLKRQVKQYVVTNGTGVAQEKKLRLSGLGQLMDGVFISEEIGAEKPSLKFFNKVFESIIPAEKDEIMIIGDSLTSDIRGGLNAGIRTCWYNPKKVAVNKAIPAEYMIEDLNEILPMVAEWR